MGLVEEEPESLPRRARPLLHEAVPDLDESRERDVRPENLSLRFGHLLSDNYIASSATMTSPHRGGRDPDG